MQPGQGSGRNGDHYLFRPAGVPAGASMYVDFVARRAWRGLVAPVEFEDMFSCTRSTIGYAETAAGDWGEFAIDEARITDRGLLIEPAATDISMYPIEGSSWTLAQATASDDVDGPYLGIFTDPQVVTSTATTLNTRARSSTAGTAVVASTQYALTFWVKAGSTSLVGLFGTVSAGTSRLTIDLANGYSVVSSSNSRGDMTFVSGRLVAGVHEIKALWTPSATAGADIGAGPGAGISGETMIVVGFRMEAGSIHYSPSGPGAGSPVTRSADSVVLALPSGTHDLTFTFDDGSTQVVTGQSGTPAIPTNLNRRIVRSVKAVAA